MLLLILILAARADAALAVLLVAVSGFVLQGVNNTGPDAAGAAFVLAAIAICLVAPVAAFTLRAKSRPRVALAAALLPLAGALLALVIPAPY